MTCDDRGCRRAGLLWPMVLAAGICLLAAGCSWTPDLRHRPIGPASWLSVEPGSKAETEDFKKKVEADSFPTASQTGI